MKYIPAILLASFLLTTVYFTVNYLSYWDPLRLCYISIDGVALGGNSKTIQKAIKLLKKEDREGYRALCKWVDRINERSCMSADWMLNKDQPGSKASGCYIRGSRIIYVKPNESDSASVIRQRADSIKRYAQYSKEFWENLD